MWAQGDQFRRLHPERSVLDQPSKYGVYSLKLKQMLLDQMTAKQNKTKETKDSVAVTKADSTISEADSSNGLSSRLDRVRITSDAEDIVNGNTSTKTDDNGNRNTKNNMKEKTIIVKDMVATKTAEKTENDKNRAKVLTQGDKLNIIKASRQQQEKMEKSERKITDFHKQTKVSSRVSKPNILPKRDSVTSSTTRSSSSRRPTSPATTRSSSKNGRVRNGPVR